MLSKLIRVIRSVMPLLLIVGAVATVTYIEPSFAAIEDGPEWLNKKTTDTSKIDKGLKTGIDYALYFAIGLSVLGVAVGLIVATPIVGHRKQGIEIIKWSLIILAASSLFWLLIGLFFTVVKPS